MMPAPPLRSMASSSTAWGASTPDGLQAALDAKPEHACGGGPMVAVMRAARAAGARDARILDYADSGDVSGDKSTVVGYLAAALGRFDEPATTSGHSGTCAAARGVS